MIWAISLFIGYLIGSISPSFILGKILKNIDIREHGDGNAGGSNVYRLLGLKAAAIVVIIDLPKGLASMYLASKLGAEPLFIHLTGLAAVAGHVFPFYLSFRGGKGIGTSIGIMGYYFYEMIKHKWFSPYLFLLFILILIIIHVIIRKKEILGMIALPLLLIVVLVFTPINLISIFTGIYILYIFVMNILLNYFNLWKRKVAE